MIKSIFILISALVISFMFACAPKHENTSPTGGDAGGGEILPSTANEVEAAIKEAMIQFKVGKFTEREDLMGAVRTVIDHRVEGDSKLLEEVVSKGSHDKNIEKSKVTFDMKDCPGVSDHKQAAVAAHSIGATICFNVPALQKIPATGLVKTLIALIAHEYMHLVGFREPEAQQFQRMVVESLPKFEMYQYVYFQSQVVRSYLSVLNNLNDIVLAISEKKFDQADVLAKAFMPRMEAFKDLHYNHVISSIIKVNDKEKMIEIGDEFLNNYEDIIVNNEPAGISWIETEEKAKTLFCRMSEQFFPYRDAVFTFEEANALLDLGEEGAPPKHIVIAATKVAIQCKNIGAEKFDNSDFLELQQSN